MALLLVLAATAWPGARARAADDGTPSATPTAPGDHAAPAATAPGDDAAPADAAPSTAAAPPSAAPAPLPAPSSSAAPLRPPRRHEYGLLIGGIVAFFVPWIATMAFAGHYLDYNPNAARVGFVPAAGPLLARRYISDKDLKDGYDIGLTVDGAIQIVAASALVAGILYAAIGVPASKARAAGPRWRPRVAAGPRGGRLAVEVVW